MNLPRIDLAPYVRVLRVSAAWQFDIGTILLRMFGIMLTIGTISMFTLASYSAFIAGTIAATVSLSTFIVAPRVSAQIDRRGQSRVVPLASSVALVGLVGLVLSVLFAWPLPVCYVFACLMGASPNGQSLARTRWTFLIRTNHPQTRGIGIRTAFAYEGVLEDIVFMFSPALNIALATAVHPVAGMVFGGCCLIAGTLVLNCAKASEPVVGWTPTDDPETSDVDESILPTRFTAPDSPWVAHSEKTVFSLCVTVRTMFFGMVLLGLVFGAFDSTTVVFCQGLGMATFASFVMAASGVISAVSGFLFGGMSFKTPPARMLVITACLYGVAYSLTAFSFNAASLFVLGCIASPLFAPFLITANSAVERAVPGSRLTEGMTWMNAGSTLGFAFGPTVAGVINDTFGARYGFLLVAVAGLLYIPLFLAAKKRLANELA